MLMASYFLGYFTHFLRLIQEHKIDIFRDSNWYTISLSFVSLIWKDDITQEKR